MRLVFAQISVAGPRKHKPVWKRAGLVTAPLFGLVVVCVRWHGKLSDPLVDGRSRQDRAKDEASHHNVAVRQTRLLS